MTIVHVKLFFLIIKKHKYTFPLTVINNRDNPNENYATRIYSDCWAANQERYFNDEGYTFLWKPFCMIRDGIILLE